MEANSTCAMVLMMVLNVFVFIAGATAFIAGMILKFDSGLLEDEVLTLLNKIPVDSVPLGNIADANVYLMIIGGVFVMVIGILGLCGAWKDIKSCLWMYIIIIIVLILLQVVIAALWIFMRQTSDEWLKGKLLEQMENYEGPEAEDEVSKGFNTLFMKGKCCGINDQYENDGVVAINDFRDRPSKWWANRGSDYIPATCCQGATQSTKKNYIGSATCPANSTPKNYYQTGCYKKITIIVERYSLVMLVVLGVIFFVQVTAIVCACLLVKTNKVDNTPERDRRFDQKYPDPAKPKYGR